MFQVMYEYDGAWPTEEPIKVNGRFMDKAFSGVIQVSPKEAKRKANNYLSNDISTGIYADSPMLVWGGKPHWRLGLSLRLPTLGTTGIPRVIEVDALTGTILSLSVENLTLILEMANDIAQRITLETAPAL